MATASTTTASGANANLALAQPILQNPDTTGLPYLPQEIVDDIMSHINDTADLASLRLVDKTTSAQTTVKFCKAVARSKFIFSTYESVMSFSRLLDTLPAFGECVKQIFLVADGMKKPTHGLQWQLNQLENMLNPSFTHLDRYTLNDVMTAHDSAVDSNNAWTMQGGYRLALRGLINRLPDLIYIHVRNIQPGEHIPGWVDVAKFEHLSFFHRVPAFSQLFYGDWVYDELHGGVTCYEDEFGDWVEEEGHGPQVGFAEDLAAAMKFSKAVVVNHG